MPINNIVKKREQLLELIKKKAYFRQKIILSSGKESDFYIDARRITLNPAGAYLSGCLILDLIKEDSYDAIGGPTLGADPLLGAIGVLSFQAQRPVNTFIIRKEPKSHGRKQQIEGPPLKEGSRVIIIDDVATTGKAFLHSLDILSELNVRPLKAVCIVDRNEGAKDSLAKAGCPLISIFDISEIHSP